MAAVRGRAGARARGRPRKAPPRLPAAERCGGCPIGALTAELIATETDRGAELTAHMDRRRGYLEAGLQRMRAARLLREDANPKRSPSPPLPRCTADRCVLT